MRKSLQTDHICSRCELTDAKPGSHAAINGSAPHETNGSSVLETPAPPDIPVALSTWDEDHPDQARREAARRIKSSIAYMMQHPNKPLPVAQLSAMAGVSPSHYFALFKCATGFAPIDFFIRVRMQRACELLRDTSSNVKQVAALLGYADPFYFSRLFKSVNGVAPSFYRVLMTDPQAAQRNTAVASAEKEPVEAAAKKLRTPPTPAPTPAPTRASEFPMKPAARFPARPEFILTNAG